LDVPAPDHSHAPHSHAGVPWLDIVIAISAIFISVVSLVVSVQHGKTMEKMVEQNEKLVAASTMPFLTARSGNIDPVTLKPSMHFTLKNGGVGPAVIDTFEFRYKGIPYHESTTLLRACCSAALPANRDGSGAIYSNIAGSILPARESVDFLLLAADEPAKLQKAVNDARKDMTFSACYCSVLNECWQTDFEAGRPKPIPACPKDDKAVLW